jgi:pilus assembly protein CpaB
MIRRVIAFGIAFVLAVVGTVLVLGYINTADSRAMAGKKAVTVLVAKERISAGTSADKVRDRDLVEQVQMPAETVPRGALTQLDQDLDDLVLTADVQQSQLLLRGMFGHAAKSTGGLAVPDGKVAVSVELEVPADVAGFVRAGSDIAVFDTYTKDSSSNTGGTVANKGDDQATRILLPNVEVLAVGSYGVNGTETSDGKKTTSDTNRTRSNQNTKMLVTVAVTQEQAEKLVHAIRTGELYLALVTDSSDVKSGPGVDNKSLFK